METMKDIISLVKDLPELAIWLVFFYYFYKLAIVGSIFAVIRYGLSVVLKVKERRYELENGPKQVRFDSHVIGEEAYHKLLAQVERIARGTRFIHESDVIWLREAIDMREAKDAEENAKAEAFLAKHNTK